MYQINATNMLDFDYSLQPILCQEDKEQANKNSEVLSGWTAIYKFMFGFVVSTKIVGILEQKSASLQLA